MLDYLNLELSGQHYGKKTLSIFFENKQGRYRLKYNSCLYEIPGVAGPSFSDEDSLLNVDYVDAWSEKIESLGLYGWSDRYSSGDGESPDSMHWYLEYREFGNAVKYSEGSNAYPGQWDEFIYALNKISPTVCFPGNVDDATINALVFNLINRKKAA